MPILIGKIKNLFWNNNSYKRPNDLPEFEETKNVRIKPQIYDFMGGRVHLKGTQWNYAIHKGIYYFLKIEAARDVVKEHYSYALVRDIWMNIIMKHSCLVRGRLTCSNNDEWLKRNINRTTPILFNPVNVRRVNLENLDYKLKDHVITNSITNEFPMKVLGKYEKDQLRGEWIKDAKYFKWLVDNGFYQKNRCPLIIFAFLKGTESLEMSWKEKVKEKANSFLKEIQSNEEIVISKVKTVVSSNLAGLYCITWKKQGIGEGIENVRIDNIDLSKVTDIVPIHKTTLQPLDKASANKDISELNVDITGEIFERKLLKFRRQIYFPITSDPTECGIALKKHKNSESVETNWNWLHPQKLKLFGNKEIFLMWIDDVNFQLSYSKKFRLARERTTTHGTYWAYSDYSSMMDFYKKMDETQQGETWSFYGDKFTTGEIKEIYPFMSFGRDLTTHPETEDPNFYERNFINEMGFMLFQFKRDLFDRFVYKGEKSNRIPYISGINKAYWMLMEKGTHYSSDLPLKLPYKVEDIWNTNVTEEPWFNKWHEYLWNLNNGLHLLLRVNSKNQYYDSEVTEIESDLTTPGHAMRILNWDTPQHHSKVKIFGQSGEHRFYLSEEKHRSSIEKSKRLINNITLESLISLPIEIERGDFLINGLEYRLDEYKPVWLTQPRLNTWDWSGELSHWNFYVKKHSGKYFWKAWYKLEDYIESGKYEVPEKTAIICNNDDKLQISILRKFQVNHRLKNSFDQAVENIDGGNAKTIDHYIIKNLTKNEIEINDKLVALNENQIKKAVFNFYKANDYILTEPIETESSFNAKILWYDDEDLKGREELLFDLVGSDWYLFIKDEKTSLIAKTANLFTSSTAKITSLKNVDEINKLSVIEKVNQLCLLNIYTKQIPLKTRFNFDGSETFDMELTSIKPTHKNNPTNYFLFKLRSSFDVAEREIISIQKNELDESASMMDNVTLENLRVQMARNDRDYVYSTERIGLEREILAETFRRRKFDLDTAKMKYWINSSFNLGITALPQVSMVDLRRMSQSNSQTIGIGNSSFSDIHAIGDEFLQESPSIIANLEPSINPKWTANRKASMNFSDSGTKSIAIGKELVKANLMSAQQIGNMILHGTRIFPELQSRVDIDKRLKWRNLAYDTLAIDLTHRDVEEDSIRNINNIANIYHKGTINELSIIEEFNKENKDIFGKKLENVYLTIFTPSEEQLKTMIAHKEEFGIECDIPDAIVEISRGMGEDVIRFRNLDDKGITGLTLRTEREYLMGLLEMGIKVVDLQEKPFDSNAYTCVNIHNLKTELSSKTTTDQKQMQLIEHLTAQLNESKKQQEEAERKVKLLEGHSKTLEDCLKNNADINSQVKSLSDQLNHEKIEKEIAQQKEADALRAKIEKETELNQKNKTIEELNQKLEQAKGGKELISNADLCKLVRELTSSSKYEIDIGKRDDGLSKFTDLCAEIALSISWIRKTDIESHLGNSPIIKKILEKIWELEEIKTIDVYEDVITNPRYKQYTAAVEALKEGEILTNMNLVNIDNLVKEIKGELSNLSFVHAVRETLDELFYLTYKAQQELSEEIQNNEELDHFFKHFFPGQQIKQLYTDLYGLKPEIAVVKKKFLQYEECDELDDTVIEWLNKEIASLDIPIKTAPSSKLEHKLPSKGAYLKTKLLTVNNNQQFFWKECNPPLYYFLNEKEIASFIAPKITSYSVIMKNNVRPYIKQIEMIGDYYTRQAYIDIGKKKDFKYFKLKITYDLLFAGSARTPEKYKTLKQSKEMLIRKTDKKLHDVYENRKQLWREREQIILPDAINQKLENGELEITLILKNILYPARTYRDGGTDQPYEEFCQKINLTKIFGKEKAKDAYKLMIILILVKSHWRFEEWTKMDNLNKFAWSMTQMNISDFNLTNKLLWARITIHSNFWEISNHEFLDMTSFMNYVYKHIKNPDQDLTNTFTEYSTINFENMADNVIKLPDRVRQR